MKNTFWVDAFASLILLPLYLLISTATFTTLLILSIRTSTYTTFIIIGIIILYAIGIVLTIIPKEILSKITFTEEYIKIVKFGKTKALVKWQDVLDVKGIYRGRSTACIVFTTENCNLLVVPTKKMYQYILSICPRQGLRYTIKNLSIFSGFNRQINK